MKPKILVTSAAGHTGAPAVFDLLERGFPVRAFVRRRDSRAARLEQAGAVAWLVAIAARRLFAVPGNYEVPRIEFANTAP